MVLLKLKELERDEQIHFGRSEESVMVEIFTKTVNSYAQEIVATKHTISIYKEMGAEEWRYQALEDRVQFLSECMKADEAEINRLNERIESGETKPEDTCYRRYIDSINIKQEYTAEDAISLIHETGHAVTAEYLANQGVENGALLSELPAILAEFIADKQLEQAGLGGEHRAAGRVVDMQTFDAKTIVLLNQVFSEFEQTGAVSFETVDKALYKGFVVAADSKGKHKEKDEYSPDDVNHFRTMLRGIKYFLGTASALALREVIKTKDDLDNFFLTFNDTDLTDSQRLEIYGVTQENITTSLNDFVQKNRSQTVDKMEKPWDDIQK